MQTANASLTRLISAAVGAARAEGLDYLGQTQRALRTVQAVEPDLTHSDALRLVERLRMT